MYYFYKFFRRIKKSLKLIYFKLINVSFSPFRLGKHYIKSIDISDLFIWGNNFENIYFIAENHFALISGEKKDIKHIFKFYSQEGKLIKEFFFKTNDYFSKIKLPKIFTDSKYISFTHFKESNLPLKKFLNKKGFSKKVNFASQSRGYTLFYPKGSNVGSAVHGNFGGISKDNYKTAIQREKFLYTSVYLFKKDYSYDLVFNNPTSNELSIMINLQNINQEKVLNILPMGTKYETINNYTGLITYESNLPICRPLILKNPPPNNLGFDVFHG